MSVTTEQWDGDGKLDLRALLSQLAAKRWWLVISVCLFTGLFVFAAYSTTPTYRSQVLLISASSDRNSISNSLGSALGSLGGGIAALTGVSIGASDPGADEAIAVLKSMEFTEAFIHDKNLIPELFPGKWNAATGQWRVPEDERPTPAKAFKLFNSKIRAVSVDKRNSLVSLQIDWRDRVEAAAWANELVERLNAEMQARALAKANASLGYLEKELATASVVETRDAINRLIESQIKTRMIADTTREYAFRVVDRAMVADADDPVWPVKSLFFLCGPLLGLGVGIGLILLWDAVAGVPPATRPNT
jgi:uncharacterized protein involved in exopolysaccharide biosynthesis